MLHIANLSAALSAAAFIVVTAAQSTTVSAQDQHDPHRPPPDSAPAPMSGDSSTTEMPGMGLTGIGHTKPPGAAGPDMGMRPGPLDIPMTRAGSGTSWRPDATVMYAQHFAVGGWELMAHGQAFVTYDRQVGGPRGDTQFGSQNWGMLMASHQLGDGRLQLRGMISLDPWTVTERGYPLILQSGEEYNGVALHDRQHPHDLFMELAADYQAPLTKQLGVELYAAPVGEPAVGPVAFPHRPSAESDPFAPLSHHWQDATHIAFGVLTAGLFTHYVKLEGSIFNGREPDQHRADFDFTEHSPTLDSYAGRLTVNPSSAWSVSSWYAYLRSPESLDPGISIRRFGASILNGRPFGRTGQWSSSLIWGANLETGVASDGELADHRVSNSALLETNLDVDGSNTVFGRAEFVQKLPGDLDVAVPTAPAPTRFNIGSFSVGYVREIGAFTKYGSAGIGAVMILNAIPGSLQPYYHTRTPYGWGLFLRFRPSHTHREDMGQSGGMHNMHMGDATADGMARGAS